MKTGRLISVGGIYADINVPNFPISKSGLQLETEIVGGDYILELGGSAVNFARLCSALEIPTAFIGKIGNDHLGEIVISLLVKAGIYPSLITSDSVSTNVSFNMVNATGESVMAVAGTANQALTADEVYKQITEFLDDSSYFYIGGCFKLKTLVPAFVKLAQDAKARGTKVVLDHGRLNDTLTEEDKETVRQLALLADIYLPSEDEFRQLWNVDSIEAGLLNLRQQGAGTVIVKAGKQGAKTLTNGQIVTVESFAVTPIHTIGAGDSFNAGFIAAQSKGMDIIGSMRFACATGALKISQTALPTYQQIIQLVQDS